MFWRPPPDTYDPDRFDSGDAIRDRLAVTFGDDADALLLSLDVDRLRPYVVLALLQMTNGEPKEFYWRAHKRLTQVYGTPAEAERVMITALACASPNSRQAWIDARKRE